MEYFEQLTTLPYNTYGNRLQQCILFRAMTSPIVYI